MSAVNTALGRDDSVSLQRPTCKGWGRIQRQGLVRCRARRDIQVQVSSIQFDAAVDCEVSRGRDVSEDRPASYSWRASACIPSGVFATDLGLGGTSGIQDLDLFSIESR